MIIYVTRGSINTHLMHLTKREKRTSEGYVFIDDVLATLQYNNFVALTGVTLRAGETKKLTVREIIP